MKFNIKYLRTNNFASNIKSAVLNISYSNIDQTGGANTQKNDLRKKMNNVIRENETLEKQLTDLKQQFDEYKENAVTTIKTWEVKFANLNKFTEADLKVSDENVQLKLNIND